MKVMILSQTEMAFGEDWVTGKMAEMFFLDAVFQKKSPTGKTHRRLSWVLWTPKFSFDLPEKLAYCRFRNSLFASFCFGIIVSRKSNNPFALRRHFFHLKFSTARFGLN